MELRLFLIYLLYFCTKNVFCHTPDSYVLYTLENDKVCSYNFKINEFSLNQNERSGIIIRTKNYWKNWTGDHSFDCKFTVKTFFTGIGFFAVTQKMSLRKKPDQSCIDYVQFRESSRSKVESIIGFEWPRGDDGWGNKFCGVYSVMKQSGYRSEENSVTEQSGYRSEENRLQLLPLAYRLEPTKELDIRIHVGKTKLLPNQTLDIEIVFTSYLDCKISKQRGSYRACGNRTYCIHKKYFDDNILNCPYEDCFDESGCSPSEGDEGETRYVINTRLIVTGATSIFLSFFLFLGCIWLCRYLELLCWSGGGSVSSGVELEPSAPPTDHDPLKDPPPAYEDLFPHGAPPDVTTTR